MPVMARKRKPADQGDGEQPKKKRYPSRDAVKYIGIPVAFYEALERYAAEHSTEFDRKSVSWAARVLFGPVLQAAGVLGKPGSEGSD